MVVDRNQLQYLSVSPQKSRRGCTECEDTQGVQSLQKLVSDSADTDSANEASASCHAVGSSLDHSPH